MTATTGYKREHGLTIEQQNAVDRLVAGDTDQAAADAIGVNRVTVTKWRLYDLTVEAAYSKHRRRDVLPLRADLAVLLCPYLSPFAFKASSTPRIAKLTESDTKAESNGERASTGQLGAGTWVEKPAKMLRRDLRAARAKWLADAPNDAERKRRERSSALRYRDEAGRVFDFHALRHQFITNLARGKVHPKDAQALARHSSITLTMDTYTHLGIREFAGALDALPALPTMGGPASEAAELPATGTDGKPAEFWFPSLVAQGVAQESRKSAPEALPIDPELAAVVAAWPTLPKATRRRIAALAKGEK